MENFLNGTIGSLLNHDINRSEATKLILDEIEERRVKIIMVCYDHIGNYHSVIPCTNKLDAQRYLLAKGKTERIEEIDWDISRLEEE